MLYNIRNMDEYCLQLTDCVQKLVIVEFTAIWCESCKAMSPIIEELSKEFQDTVFLTVDIVACPELVDEYNIDYTPAFIVISRGDVIDHFMATTEERLRQCVEKHHNQFQQIQ